MRPKGSAKELERRRRLAIKWLQKGRTAPQVAEVLGCSARSVHRWRVAYEKNRRHGLAPSPPPRRPARLRARQNHTLVRRLRHAAKAIGVGTDLWTCGRIAALIETLFGVRYHVDSMPRFLAALDFSCQKPQKRPIERDEPAIERWIERDWRRIKKKPHAREPT